MRLTLVIGSLRCGGAERILAWLANGWRRDGHAVTLVTLQGGRESPFFRLDPGVSLAPLAVSRPSRHILDAVMTNVGRVRALRAAFRQSRPDVIVSFLTTTNVLALLAAAGLPAPVIVSERVHPALCPLPGVWRWLRKRLYPRARAVVVQTDRATAWFPGRMRSRVVVIPNPVARPDRAGPRKTRPDGHGTVLGVGRLTRQKGFDLLIRAFAEATRPHDGWDLVIAGEGPERQALAGLAARCGVADRVRLIGRQADIQSTYTATDIFALPSRFEGFPNALLEAMAAGLPAVAADCLAGPREIICNERNGLLVEPENVEALTLALSRLLTDASLRRRLGAAAAGIVEAYDADAVHQRWNALVAEVAGERHVGRTHAHPG